MLSEGTVMNTVMAGIRLPDIGKLGIRIATGMRDRKTVAPSNMAEDAKLKSLSSKLDNEKQERNRYLKKEERRLKRRKQTIDKRRGDIGLNVPGERKPGRKLPPIASRSDSSEKRKNSVKDISYADDGKVKAMFPIQDELGLGNFESKRVACLPQASSPRATASHAKVVLPSLEIEEQTPRRNSKKRKTKASHKPKEQDQIDWRQDEDDQERQKSCCVKRDSPSTNDSAKDSVTEELVCSETQSYDFQNALIKQNKMRTKSSGGGKRTIQQSLEEAFLAIQACRYIRTPSKQTFNADL